MTIHTVTAGRTTRRVHEVKPAARGYAASRQAYDRRRRQRLDPHLRAEIRAYTELLRRDPCSYCMDFCGQMAADHIVPLNADGENAPSNLTAAGRPCNAAKKDKPLLMFMLERRR